MTSSRPKYSNELTHETSPYLLQHAHNPVDWHAWNERTLEKAKSENKLLLISIGYSACHWCHVMERESFENETVATIMNAHFVCIKVDREERPDIDQVYMNAVQIMTGSGGWPLNCIALPDGQPIYGGTYFPPERWKKVLLHLVDLYANDLGKVKEYAAKLTLGVQQSELINKKESAQPFSVKELQKMILEWSKRLDYIEGGPDKAPKFPLPNNYQFLLRYANFTKDSEILKQVELTLKKMAWGGIYDQLGGGFSRYAVDSLWKVPHFEKMLYDNAQLISLYSEAYQFNKDPLYKQIVEETLAYVELKLTSPEGGFYSAQDADSEGEEGKYYVWEREELEKLLGENYAVFAAYYSVNEEGFWEHGKYILVRKKSEPDISKEFEISEIELKKRIAICKQKLLTVRENRAKPALDDKQLCSWNALMIKGYTDAFRALGEMNYLKQAEKGADFLRQKFRLSDHSLLHSYKNEKASVNGFLEDYAFSIEAFISLYECTFKESYLVEAEQLLQYVLEYFYDEESGFFFFTSAKDSALIARKMETSDNVIPASNSSLAKSLFLMGQFFEKEKYIRMAEQMLHNVSHLMQEYGAGYSNWAMLHLYKVAPFYEIVLCGKNIEILRKQLEETYIPNKILMGSNGDSRLPLLKDKFVEGKNLVYVCENKSCRLPVSSVEAALQHIN